MANLINDFINGVYSYGNSGSSMANAVSAGAQQKQMNFNAGQADLAYERDLEMLGMQSAYNSAEAAAQREYNTAMWNAATEANRENAAAANAFAAAEAQKAREFNAAEAQKARDWTERMSNTAYQRAVADMKAAGINPILAAMNGGASAGSGASASGTGASASMANSAMASSGMASMSAGSAPMASGSNYTGQGNNMSENLAMMGAIAYMFGDGLSGLATSMGTFAENLGLVDAAKELAKVFEKEGTKEVEQQLDNWSDGELSINDFGLERTGGGILGIFDRLFGGPSKHSKTSHSSYWTGGGGGRNF